MTNYDMDELRKQEHEKVKNKLSGKWPKSVELGKDEEPWTAIDIELKDEDFVKIAYEAHVRDITFYKMVNIMLKGALKDAQYRFEHDSRPQLLNEDK